MEQVTIKDLDFENRKRTVALNTGLNENAREQVSEKLKSVLADSYLLMLKTHYYHWNVKGPLFKSLHDLTEQQYTELFTAIDDVAERIRALGHEAPGSFSTYHEISEMKEAISGLSGMEMSADLVKSHETLIANLRATLNVADEAQDEVTVDMMVGRLNAHEKSAWMLRSFIEK